MALRGLPVVIGFQQGKRPMMTIEMVADDGRRMRVPRGWILVTLTLAAWGVVSIIVFAIWGLVTLLS